MKLHSSKWGLVAVAVLLTASSALGQPGPGPDGGPPQESEDPLVIGLTQKLRENFTPEKLEAVRKILQRNGSEMEKCQAAFVQDIATAFELPVEKVQRMFEPPAKGEAPDRTPLHRKLSDLLGKYIYVDGVLKIRAANKKQLACAEPWQRKLVQEIATVTGLPEGEVEALTPWAEGFRTQAASDSPDAPDHDVPGDYISPHLQGHLRICPGVARPAATDRVLLPLMAANRERFEGKSVLDLGTGAGLIGLYAAQLGAAKVVATDSDPRAVDCARENARWIGLSAVVETRLVTAPEAYSGIQPREVFELVAAAPSAQVDLSALDSASSMEERSGSNDCIRRGLAIIKGLSGHLARDGTALLFFPSDLAHGVMVGYARHLGYDVEHHPAQVIYPPDFYALYNTFAAQVARTEQLEPGALLLRPPARLSANLMDQGYYRKVDWVEDGQKAPRLWGKRLDRTLPGVIVIRNREAASGPR